MTGGLRPYPEYKDSELLWLGQMPSHWDIRKNGRLFVQRNETGFGSLPILEVSLKTGVRVRNMDDFKRKQVMSDYEKYKRAVKGDIAYNMMRMWQGAVGVAPVDGLVSPAYVVARPFPEADPRYFSYLFRTYDYMNEVDGYSRGIVKDRNRLYWEDFKRMPSCNPPLSEQKLIANYLDANAIKVRRFIRNRRRLIQVVNEQKQAIINQAVTRGLDPNVPLKPAGIDLPGDTPEHWKRRAAGQLFFLGRGEVISNEYIGAHPGPYPVYSSQTAIEGIMGFIDSFMFDGEYLTWTTDGAHAGTVFLRSGKFNCTNVCGTLRPKEKVHLPFMRYALSIETKHHVRLDINPKLMNNMMARIRVNVPPYDEQIRIAEELLQQIAGIDRAIHIASREIDLIREYRTRLIADVVTGKIDVRHLIPETIKVEAEDLEEGLDDEMPGKNEMEFAEEETDADD